ncbi:MAG TPA: response regulator [Candidatus Omnitrophota bacterium]|nr:response regulator [Candidatus Omnitrophota bacterium]
MPHKILVVDDERVSLSLIKFGLAGERYNIIMAHDGQEALQKVEDEKPDLIILDVQMPNMNGYEFMQELKQKQGIKTTPVIMVTSNETMEDLFLLEGVKAYFVKPVKLAELIEKVRQCLGPNPL